MGGNPIILDAGAVSALASKGRGLRIALRSAVHDGSVIFVPAPVIVESTTGNGARDALVNAALKACLVIDLDETLARAAGRLRHRHRDSGAIDAMVIACADALPGATVITGDPRDLQRLASEQGRTTVVDINRLWAG